MSSSIFPDPITRHFVEAVTSPDSRAVHGQAVEVARANDIASQAAYKPTAEADSMDIFAAGGPNGPIPVRILRPKTSREVLPLIVFFHGGRWVLGDRQTADRLARDLAVAADAAVAIVEYSRAPEAQYPVAIEECYAATQYLYENAGKLRLDRSQLVIAGDSAGGILAIVVCLMAKRLGGPGKLISLAPHLLIERRQKYADDTSFVARKVRPGVDGCLRDPG